MAKDTESDAGTAGEVPDAPVLEVVSSPMEQALRQAVLDHLGDGPAARDTSCWNAIQAAIPAMAASLSSI